MTSIHQVSYWPKLSQYSHQFFNLFHFLFSIKIFDGRIKNIIVLAFVLASGSLLSILACALYGNWLPLIVVLIYLLAAVPNPLCQRCTPSHDILSDNSNSGFSDAGKFLTSVFVVSGFGLPLVLSHSELIKPMAAALSISGGILIYASIILYGYFFSEEEAF